MTAGLYGRLVRPARRRRVRWWAKGTHSKHAYPVITGDGLVWRSCTKKRTHR